MEYDTLTQYSTNERGVAALREFVGTIDDHIDPVGWRRRHVPHHRRDPRKWFLLRLHDDEQIQITAPALGATRPRPEEEDSFRLQLPNQSADGLPQLDIILLSGAAFFVQALVRHESSVPDW